jgi:hypothetical protein
MIAACVMLSLGVIDSAAAAIEHVRSIIGRTAVQTARQAEFVASFDTALRGAERTSDNQCSLMIAAASI